MRMSAPLFPAALRALHIFSARRAAGLSARDIDIDGTPLRCLDGGSGRALLLLDCSGANASHAGFSAAAYHLRGHYRVLIPQLTGLATTPHALAWQAERLHAMLDHLGVGQVHLGGHGSGGALALRFAELHPERAASLWLIDPAPMPADAAPRVPTLLVWSGSTDHAAAQPRASPPGARVIDMRATADSADGAASSLAQAPQRCAEAYLAFRASLMALAARAAYRRYGVRPARPARPA